MREIIIESIASRLSTKTEQTQKSNDLKAAIEETLKKYAPALEKLAKS